MAINLWAILCSKASIDTESNNISLFDVTEQLNIRGAPKEQITIAVKFDLVLLWMRSNPTDTERAIGRFRLIMPGGLDKGGIQVDVDLTRSLRHRNIIKLNSLPINGPGIYYFVIEIQENGNWKEANKIPLEIIIEPETKSVGNA